MSRRLPLLALVSVAFLAVGSVVSLSFFMFDIAVCFGFARISSGAPISGAFRRMTLAVALIMVCSVLVVIRVVSAGNEFASQVVAGVPIETIGVAYFTLQAVSFLLYNYRTDAINVPLVNLVLYMGFYPHAFAGPVLRPGRFLPELGLPRKFDGETALDGLLLIIFGLFKKRVLADGLIGAVIDTPVSRSPLAKSIVCGLLFMATYMDVSGYVDIARGLGKAFGLNIPVNFSAPITRSRSIQNFWQRWQVTLMGWFRDHVYAPVSGCGIPGSTVVATIATFAAVAFWHGLSASWARWFGVVILGALLDYGLAACAKRNHGIRGLMRIARRLLVLPYVLAISVAIAWPAANSLAGLWALRGTSSVTLWPLIGLLLVAGIAVCSLEALEIKRDSRLGQVRRLVRTECVVAGVMSAWMLMQMGAAPRLLIYGAF